MPTYDYACRACGHSFEVFHSMSADPVRVCPECGESAVERMISGGAGTISRHPDGPGQSGRDSRNSPDCAPGGA